LIIKYSGRGKMNAKTAEEHASGPDARDFSVSRLLGVYPQRQDGLFMQRIKVLGGRISWKQWRRVAELANRFSSGTALHMTTRQDIELHNISADDIPVVQRALAEVELTTHGAGGDGVRNVTVCPGCSFDPSSGSVYPVARLVHQYFLDSRLDLPRKFKISFSGCQMACAKPWLNDLGFIARRDGSFAVIGAGSLGAKPALGIELYRDLPTTDVLPLCVAAVKLFEQHGDRENRRRARFRHIRERVGDQVFRKELDVRFTKLKSSQPWPDVSVEPANRNTRRLWRLQLPNGNISPEDAVELADAAEPTGAILRINLEHGLELFGSKAVQLPQRLAVLETYPVIVACPGSSVCGRALVDGWALAERIRETLAGIACPDICIGISSCPNNCAHSAVADMGLVGVQRRRDGERDEAYRLFAGGGNGKTDKPAEQRQTLSAEEVCDVVRSRIESFSI
jgi:sulfite reductase beta subunit-like hemoprotein